MAQFDVYRNEAGNADKYPYVMVLQSDLIELQGHHIVAPLSLSSRYREALITCPQITIDDESWLAVIPQLAAIPHQDKVASMKEQRSDIISALDRLFTGF